MNARDDEREAVVRYLRARLEEIRTHEAALRRRHRVPGSVWAANMVRAFGIELGHVTAAIECGAHRLEEEP